MSAVSIALNAHQQALAAQAAKKAAEEQRKREAAQLELAEAQITFEKGLPLLQEWFPGIHWQTMDPTSGRGSGMGYSGGRGIIVQERGAEWGDPLKLCIERTIIASREEVKVYAVRSHSDGGYSYFDGPEVKSPAAIGAWLDNEQSERES